MARRTDSDFRAVAERLARVEQQIDGLTRRAGFGDARLSDHRKLLYETLHRLSFPVHLAKDGTPVLVDGGRSGVPKFLLISIPRSGTHLAAELLRAVGLISAGLHLSADGKPNTVQDRRFFLPTPTGSGWKNYDLSLAEIIRLMRPGQFVQGHIPFSPDLTAAVDRVAVVYVDRNLRDVLISSMRFIEQLAASGVPFVGLDTSWCGASDTRTKLTQYLRSFGPGVADSIESISPWQALPEAFTLEFDRIAKPRHVGDAIEHLRELTEFIGIEQNEDQLAEVLKSRVGAQTATWTGRLSNFQELWSDEAEQVFNEIGFRRFTEA